MVCTVNRESSKLRWKCLSCSLLISATYELIIIIKLVFEKKLHLIMGRSSCGVVLPVSK